MLSKTLAGSVVGAILLLFSGVASAAVITNISDSAEGVSPLLPA